MKKSCALVLAVAIAVLANVAVVQAMDADELIAKNLEATGGKDKVQSIRTARMTGKFMTQGMEFPFTMTQKRPDMLRVDAEVMGMSMIQVFDGESGWSINPMSGSQDPQPMSEFEVKSFKMQADMDGPLMNYADKGYTVEYLGEEDVEGTPCYKLHLDTGQDIVMDFFFDKDYFLIVKQASVITMDENRIETETYLSDYKEVGGLVIPFSLETRMGDQVLNQIAFDEVEQNVEVDDGIFERPEKPGPPAAMQLDDK